MRDLTLKNYNYFLETIPQSWQNLAGLAYTPRRYFYLAEIQIQGFKTALEKTFEESKEPKTIDYSEQCYSYSYGFYTLIRTCLEASSKFSNAFQKQKFSQELADYRDSKKKEITTIINIANDYIKHPVENQGKVTWYEPGGLDNHGELGIYEWSTVDNNHFKVLSIYPIRDITTVFEYLEQIAQLYTKHITSKP
jgi:hypothetical protein